MEYLPKNIEPKWQKIWEQHQLYKVENQSDKPKYYVLDMFPYPSGAGLHVGHPLGYIASDIVSRYKRLQGFNVLHPMGFDSFGLPAEQYAIDTGQHPKLTTEKNIDTFKKQLGKIGFCYDWSREVRTSEPSYYKWTQWIFGELFEAWYNNKTNKAEKIDTLLAEFAKNGNRQVNAVCDEETPMFSAAEWLSFSKKQQADILLKYRLTYLADAYVNWCPMLGMALANDEVKDGVSERGGHPVERKKMRQWMMRITGYAERLLADIETLDWSESIKEMQRNWIGKSLGAELTFMVCPTPNPSPQGGEQKQILPQGGEQKQTKLLLSTEMEEKIALFRTANLKNWEKLKEFARNNRKNPTPAEASLWNMLRGDALNVNFRRQHTIQDFIVDFVCLTHKLVIEVDGEIHNQEENQEYDTARSFVLNELGYNVLRVPNEEVLDNPNELLEKIKLIIAGKGQQYLNQHLQNPSLWGGAGVGLTDIGLTVFTTRIDTIFGVTYLAIAPEHELIPQLTTVEQKQAVEAYVEKAKNRSERDRMSDVKTVSGVFTGSYVTNPFTGEKLPIWIADYVLAGYGTGVVMAVPSSDDRDFRFAMHYNLPIIKVIAGTEELENPTEVKKGKMINSGFLDGLETEEAIKKAIEFAEKGNFGKAKINYKLRDAVFARQRYWGEPVPIYFDEQEIPNLLPKEKLPLLLPEIDQYKPTETGEPPLGRAKNWKYSSPPTPEGGDLTPSPLGGATFRRVGEEFTGGLYELSTMPGWAGSSWYWLRYMDNKNENEFVSKESEQYWKQVDLYIGGSEHATGHLLYSRFWNKFLYDLGYVSAVEPFKKLINQGMIQGRSSLIYKLKEGNTFISAKLKDNYQANELVELHVDVNIVENDVLDIEAFKKWRQEYETAEFVLDNDKFECAYQVEKMSKRWYNVVNPDDVVDRYSADTLRLYEMFLGPLEQFKPWNTQGIDGTYKFLKKLWRLCIDEKGDSKLVDTEPTKEEYKTLHKTIKKVQEDIEGYSFNTPVSTFMICVNELTDLKCNKLQIFKDLLIILSPFAPHIAEELWFKLNYATLNISDWKPAHSVVNQAFPIFNAAYLTESSYEYPISINGKMRHKMTFSLDMPVSDIEKQVLAEELVQKWTEGKQPKKIIVVVGKIVNLVL